MATAAERLAQVKAERAKLAAEQAERDAASKDADDLAREEMALANERALADAESKHGRIRDGKIGAIETRLGVVIVKRPEPAFYRRFMKGTDPRADAEMLVRHCRAYPSAEAFESWMEEQPGLLDPASAVCVALAGLTAKEVQGK